MLVKSQPACQPRFDFRDQRAITGEVLRVDAGQYI